MLLAVEVMHIAGSVLNCVCKSRTYLCVKELADSCRQGQLSSFMTV